MLTLEETSLLCRLQVQEMTMDDQDREFGGDTSTSSTVISTASSDPVDLVLERLNSKSNQIVYETIIEVCLLNVIKPIN